jgi:hypothetical protein
MVLRTHIMAAMSNLISSVTNGDEESAKRVQVVYQSLAPRLANPVRFKTKPTQLSDRIEY